MTEASTPIAVEELRTPERSSLRSLALRGSVWTLLGTAGQHFLRLASSLVLARLLVPEAFGAMVLVGVFIQGLTMFSDIGIGPAIVQSERGDEPRYLNTAWTIQVGRGALLWAISWLGSIPYAAYYDKPELAAYIAVAASAAFVGGFNSTKLFTADRQLVLGRKTLIEVLSQVVGLVVMVAWALVSPTVWSLVAGSVAISLIRMVLSHTLLPGPKNRFAFDPSAATALFHFGRWIFVSTILTFFATQIDRLMLGKLVDEGTLGVYGIAITLALMPVLLSGMIAGRVLYPLLAHITRVARGELEARMLAMRNVLMGLSSVLLLSVTFFAPAFFSLLYDERYESAGWMAQLLTFPVWCMLLQITSDRALQALANTRALAVCNGVMLAAKTAAAYVGFLWIGLPGFVVGFGIGVLAGQVVVQQALAGADIRIARQDLAWTARVGALAALGVAGVPALLGVLGLQSDVYVSGAACVPLFVAWTLPIVRRARFMIRG